MLSHTSTSLSRFRFIDLDPEAVLVPVAFFFYMFKVCFSSRKTAQILQQLQFTHCIYKIQLFFSITLFNFCFVQSAVMTYNVHYKDKWDFEGWHSFCNHVRINIPRKYCALILNIFSYDLEFCISVSSIE